MNERMHASSMITLLSSAERDALAGLLYGESIDDLASRKAISTEEADDLRDSLRWKLGVRKDAEAVRIGLMAGWQRLRQEHRRTDLDGVRQFEGRPDCTSAPPNR